MCGDIKRCGFVVQVRRTKVLWVAGSSATEGWCSTEPSERFYRPCLCSSGLNGHNSGVTRITHSRCRMFLTNVNRLKLDFFNFANRCFLCGCDKLKNLFFAEPIAPLFVNYCIDCFGKSLKSLLIDCWRVNLCSLSPSRYVEIEVEYTKGFSAWLPAW